MTTGQKTLALVAALFLVCWIAYHQGESTGRLQTAAQHLEQSKKTADVARAAAVETVTVHERSKARVDTAVQVIDATTLSIRETPISAPRTVAVPALVVSRIQVDSAVIADYRRLVERDSTALRVRDSLLALPRPRQHWGLGLAGGYSCNPKGCGPGLTFGISWRW